MTLNEMIANSRKKNEKFDNVELSDFIERQFTGALNLKASKDGTGFAGAFANKLFEAARVGNLDLLIARVIGNRMQQEALDSKHDGGGDMTQTVWFQITKLFKSKDPEFKIRRKLEEILNEESTSTVVNSLEKLNRAMEDF